MWPSGGWAGRPLLPCRQLRALFRRQKAPHGPGTREILGWHGTSERFPKDNDVEVFFFLLEICSWSLCRQGLLWDCLWGVSGSLFCSLSLSDTGAAGSLFQKGELKRNLYLFACLKYSCPSGVCAPGSSCKRRGTEQL